MVEHALIYTVSNTKRRKFENVLHLVAIKTNHLRATITDKILVEHVLNYILKECHIDMQATTEKDLEKHVLRNIKLDHTFLSHS